MIVNISLILSWSADT